MSSPTCCNKTRTIILSAIIGGTLGAVASVPLAKLMGPKAAAASTPASTPAPATQPATQPAPKVDQEALRELVKQEVKAQLKEQAGRRATAQPVSEAEARASSVRSAILTLRSQIALYKLQHQDKAPTLAQLNDNWSALTQKTDASGKPTTASGGYGPYLQNAPANAFNGKTKVVAKGKPVTIEAGWVYEESTSKLWPVVPENLEQQVKLVLQGDYVVGPAVRK